MTGRATVAHCDVLIAVWDGKPPRGRGGTGEVVQLALTRGTAIIHVPLERGRGSARAVGRVRSDRGDRRRRSGRRTAARPRRRRRAPHRAADAAAGRAGAELPARLQARAAAAISARGSNIRCCSPPPGVKSFKPQSYTDKYYAAQIRDEWQRYRARLRRGAQHPRARSTCSRRPIAGRTGSRRISRRPIAAGTSSTSCSAVSRCASASPRSWRRTSSSRKRSSRC